MLPDADIHKRQLWGYPTTTTNHDTLAAHCTPFILPSNGIISFDSTTISLTTDVVFQPQCSGTSIQDVEAVVGTDPFYASTIPQTYVIAATTVIAWILVIMLIITPRTNFLGQSGSAPGFGSGLGIIGGATGGNTNLIGVGSRPWLQKVAATTVAISLTIATADTLRVAKTQYNGGYMDATALREEVLGSLEIRITRVISDVFLWLAQVQTLIRLFPRHKEKVLIKWIGFALILLDSIFSCLNSFGIKNEITHSPREYMDAIPALAYLFELALGLLYAAWVIYYSITKRRYAYYHQKMPSITLIAFLSLIAILTPVVFFVTDVSNQDVAGWGDYFRWVGAAAASVVVWEWVERIEALERDEKKDGILGREIFDGDEMLDVNPSDEAVWTGSRHDQNRYRRNGSDDSGTQSTSLEKGLSGMAQRFRRRTEKSLHNFPGRGHSQNTTTVTSEPTESTRTGNVVVFDTLPKPRKENREGLHNSLTPPLPVASPISRADTTSAASTVYVVRKDPTGDVPQPVRRREDTSGGDDETLGLPQSQKGVKDPEKEEIIEVGEDVRPNRNRGNGMWLSVTNPFKRKRSSPPAEVQQARRASVEEAASATTPAHNFSRWDVKNRLGVLAAETGEKWRDKKAGRRQFDDLPVTIIPAQPRGSGRVWTPAPTPSHESSGGTEGVESSSNQNWTGSTTIVAQGEQTRASQRSPDPPRPDTISPVGSPDTRTSAGTPDRSYRPPPRADDIRPNAGGSSPTVIPAPRRTMRSPPTLINRLSSSTPSGIAEDENE